MSYILHVGSLEHRKIITMREIVIGQITGYSRVPFFCITRR